jgi:hypothetical protein
MRFRSQDELCGASERFDACGAFTFAGEVVAQFHEGRYDVRMQSRDSEFRTALRGFIRICGNLARLAASIAWAA